MIRSIEELDAGLYVADYRFDEGFRIREDFVCPALTAHGGGGIAHERLLIEVLSEKEKVDGVSVWGGLGEKKSNGGTQWYQQDRIYDSRGISPALSQFKSDLLIAIIDDGKTNTDISRKK